MRNDTQQTADADALALLQLAAQQHASGVLVIYLDGGQEAGACWCSGRRRLWDRLRVWLRGWERRDES